MHSPSCFEFEVFGKQALFTNPYSDSLQSFPVPTYEALVSILRSFYWEPSFDWIPDELRVMNRVRYVNCVVITPDGKYVEKRLSNVRYLLRAHVVDAASGAALDLEDFYRRFNFRKAVFGRAFGRGFPVMLGSVYCAGEMRPGNFAGKRGYYVKKGTVDFGNIYHSTNYLFGLSGEIIKEQRLLHCVMKDGVISFSSAEECVIETKAQLSGKRAWREMHCEYGLLKNS